MQPSATGLSVKRRAPRGRPSSLRELGEMFESARGLARVAERGVAWFTGSLDLDWAAIALDIRVPRFIYGSSANGTFPPIPDDSRIEQVLTDGQAFVLRSAGITLGELVLGPKQGRRLDADDLEIVANATPLFASGLQNAWLIEELENQAKELGCRERTLQALSIELMRVQEVERARLAQDLHDDPLQRTILLARELGEAVAEPSAARWRAEAEDIAAALRGICDGLRPRVLEDFGLAAGIEWLIDRTRARADIAIFFSIDCPDGREFGRLAPDLELALFRVVQEALHNCLKHAAATQITILLWQEGSWVRLSVADDGVGIGTGTGEARAFKGLGIVGMQERLRPWNGRVSVEPRAPSGTLVLAEVAVDG